MLKTKESIYQADRVEFLVRVCQCALAVGSLYDCREYPDPGPDRLRVGPVSAGSLYPVC